MPEIKPSCVRILAGTFVAAVFALPAAQDARPDMYATLTEDTCWVTTTTSDKALKSRRYREALAGYTKAIEWTVKKCGQTLSAKKRIGTGPSEELKQSHLGRAIAAAGLGDYDLAARDIALLLEVDIVWLWEHRPHMRALFNNEAMSKPSATVFLDWALGIVNRAIERKPKTAVYRAARADIYEEREEFDKALAERSAQIEYARDNAEKAQAHYDRAYTRSRLGDKEGRLADLSTAIELDPEPGLWRYAERASVYKALGRIDEAIADYTKALSDEKYYRYKDYLKARADLYRESGKLDAAAKDYAKALSKQPENADYLYRLLLVRTQQGDSREVRRLRARLDKLKPGYLDNPERARELAAAGAGPAEPAASPAALREAWAMGEVVAVTPLQHLIGKPNATADKAWDMTSNFVRAGQEEAGRPPRGLGKIPEFKGAKSSQLNQAIRFILRQSKAVEGALEKKFGAQAGAVFAVSSAGYLVSTLNRMGVAKLNDRLGETIKAEGPSSGLPRDVWADTAAKTAARAKPEDVVKAWVAGSKAARDFLTKPEKKKPEQIAAPKTAKRSAAPKARKPKAEKAAVENKGVKPPQPLRKCDDLDALYFDPGTTPPCQP